MYGESFQNEESMNYVGTKEKKSVRSLSIQDSISKQAYVRLREMYLDFLSM